MNSFSNDRPPVLEVRMYVPPSLSLRKLAWKHEPRPLAHSKLCGGCFVGIGVAISYTQIICAFSKKRRVDQARGIVATLTMLLRAPNKEAYHWFVGWKGQACARIVATL